MALKSRSVQLPEQTWELLDYYAKDKRQPSVSAMIRGIITDFLRIEYFFGDFMPRLKKRMPECVSDLPTELIGEILLFMDIKNISIDGTGEEKKEKIITLFKENNELMNETLNYIEKRAKYVDDETILSWTDGIPEVRLVGANLATPPRSIGRRR